MRTKRPDSEWRKLLNARGFTRNYPFENKSLEPLKKKLLNMGGWAVVLPFKEIDLEEILERGKILHGKSTLKMGEPCRCHSNSANLWHESKGKYRICTGYALSLDGAWRQHTWCIEKKNNRIIETTEKRIKYFGYILSLVESAVFLEMNI